MTDGGGAEGRSDLRSACCAAAGRRCRSDDILCQGSEQTTWASERTVTDMNEGHLELLTSPDWRRFLEVDVQPWADEQADLRGDVLEIGPGPGLMTDLLATRARTLVAVEIDADLSRALERRVVGTNVEVVCADATVTNLASDRFDAVTAFAMLHHVPSFDARRMRCSPKPTACCAMVPDSSVPTCSTARSSATSTSTTPSSRSTPQRSGRVSRRSDSSTSWSRSGPPCPVPATRCASSRRSGDGGVTQGAAGVAGFTWRAARYAKVIAGPIVAPGPA